MNFGDGKMASAIRLPIVGVVGSSSDEHRERAARALGNELKAPEVICLGSQR
jgi:hypothetical protein